MRKFFDNLFEKDTPTKKLQTEISNTEFKMNSLIAPLQGEIRAAQQEIDRQMLKIGQSVYVGHVEGNGEINFGIITPHIEQITATKSLIAEKEAKVSEFQTRYTEEIEILKASLANLAQESGSTTNKPPESTNASVAAKAFCPHCGNTYTQGEDAFCVQCGTRLN